MSVQAAEIFAAIWAFFSEHAATLFSGIGVVFVVYILSSIRGMVRRLLKLVHKQGEFSSLNDDTIEFLEHTSDVYIDTPDGAEAIFVKKIKAKVLAKSLDEYVEPVSTVGSAKNFKTELGAVTGWKIISGYYHVNIDIGKRLKRGELFDNTFSCDLADTFPLENEDWSPRIGVPTRKLTIRVHFPKERPFKTHHCSILRGWNAKRLEVRASEKVINGRPVLEWIIDKPTFGAIYKLDWYW